MVARIGNQFHEMFGPSSLRADGPIILNVEHDEMRAIAPRGAVEMTEEGNELRMSAEVSDTPLGDRVLSEVRTNSLGLSVEFRAVKEHRDARGVRVIDEALLTGLALTARPAYTDTSVEARRKVLVPVRRVWL